MWYITNISPSSLTDVLKLRTLSYVNADTDVLTLWQVKIFWFIVEIQSTWRKSYSMTIWQAFSFLTLYGSQNIPYSLLNRSYHWWIFWMSSFREEFDVTTRKRCHRPCFLPYITNLFHALDFVLFRTLQSNKDSWANEPVLMWIHGQIWRCGLTHERIVISLWIRCYFGKHGFHPQPNCDHSQTSLMKKHCERIINVMNSEIWLASHLLTPEPRKHI
jgi:hypothetical protein